MGNSFFSTANSKIGSGIQGQGNDGFPTLWILAIFYFQKKKHKLCGMPVVVKCSRVRQRTCRNVVSLCLNSFANLMSSSADLFDAS